MKWILVLLIAGTASAAELPAHRPLSILIVGDAVNPHALSDAELTQPADIKAALEAGNSGLNVSAVTLVDSQCLDAALTLMPTVDVLVYFAHRSAHACGGADRQPQLTAAVEALLQRGGGVVVYHHGLYVDTGKEAILQLLGGQASGAVPYDTVTGQRVFVTAPGHFIATNGTSYGSTAMLTGMGAVPSGTFSIFDNIPDERYPTTSLLTEAGETREILFATDSGGTRVLGYVLSRAGWSGRVVFYQPAEYQPHALDDRDGNNFQILVNAIYFAPNLTVPAPPDAGPSDVIDAAIPVPDGSPPPTMMTDGGGGCEVGAGGGGALFVLLLLSLVAWPRRGA